MPIARRLLRCDVMESYRQQEAAAVSLQRANRLHRKLAYNRNELLTMHFWLNNVIAKKLL